LFDIYTGPLLGELNKVLELENVLSYADDIQKNCENKKKLEDCITIIKEWSQENNLKINKKKTVILEFIQRRSRTTQMNVKKAEKTEAFT